MSNLSDSEICALEIYLQRIKHYANRALLTNHNPSNVLTELSNLSEFSFKNNKLDVYFRCNFRYKHSRISKYCFLKGVRLQPSDINRLLELRFHL